MAGGHGAGSGGGKKSRLSGNGCLRFVLFYVVALGAVVGGAFVLGSGLLNNLPGIGSLTSGLSGGRSTTSQGSSTQGNGIVAVTLPGQGGGGAGSPAVTSGAQINSQQAPSPQGGTLTGWGNGPFYIVQPGDTLSSIAAAYGVTVQALLNNNIHLREPLQPYHVIYLPVAGSPLPPTGRNSGQP